MFVTRRSMAAFVIAACGLVCSAAPLAAQCPTTHADQHYTDGAMEPIDFDLVVGEGMGALFQIPPADLPAQITAVWIGSRAGPGSVPGWTGSWTAIQVWDVMNPSPASAPTYEFLAPQVAEGQVVRNDVTTNGPPMIVNVPAPRVIVVPSRTIGGPYLARDTDGTCTAGVNLWRFFVPGPVWLDVCSYAAGDVVIRIEYRSLACPTGTAYCFGDGSASACPCNNTGGLGRGCANSFSTFGGRLDAQGAASVSFDSLRLDASGLPPTSSALFLQGDVRNNGGAGVVYGDGILCVAGPLIRLGTRAASGGVVSFGAGVSGAPSISERGQIPLVGATRVYQVRYRNSASFCTPDTFNTTNALELVWAP